MIYHKFIIFLRIYPKHTINFAKETCGETCVSEPVDLQLWKGVPRFFLDKPTNLYDWDHWTSHAMCTCIGVIHYDTLIHVHEEEIVSMTWMNIHILSCSQTTNVPRGSKKKHDTLCLIPSASPKKKCWPSDGIRTRQEAQFGSRPGGEQKWMGQGIYRGCIRDL